MNINITKPQPTATVELTADEAVAVLNLIGGSTVPPVNWEQSLRRGQSREDFLALLDGIYKQLRVHVSDEGDWS